jgi:site-specific DNA-methyltransferase (adenine-specific)
MINMMKGDCMELMASKPDKFYDLAIVDPPYGIDINNSGRLGHYGGKGKKWDGNAPDKKYFSEIKRVSTNQIIWGANYFQMNPTRCFLIWDKQQPLGVSFADCEYAWTSLDESARIFRMRPQNADSSGRIHPTQKPVALYKWLLSNYAKPSDKILDTHGGSGSICIACHDMGFDLDWIEFDEDYYKAATERYNKHASQQELFSFSGGVLN